MAQPVAALIVRVAADLAELKGSVGEINSTLGGAADIAKKAAGLIGAAFSFSELSAAAERVTNMAGHIDDLAQKAGISAEAVQELDFVAKQSGGTFDQISSALAQMSKRLVEGKEGTVGALEQMGLSLDTIRAMQPDKAFEAIAVAIAKVEDPMQRSKLAMDLFGRAGAELLPVLLSNIGGLRDVARETGLVISNELVASGDDLGDSWDQVNTRLQSLMAQALLPLLGLFSDLPGPIQTVTAAVVGMAPTIAALGLAWSSLGGLITATIIPLFTTTLPAAFSALLPFLGPVGLIAAAVAAVFLVWKNWEAISGIAQRVYEGVKAWLIDRFQAVVDGIKAKIDAVTGFFKGMYDKVVGQSYVPDMVNQIDQHFGKLDDVMVKPTAAASRGVEGIFDTMASAVDGIVGHMLSGIGGRFGEFLSSVVPSFGSSLTGALGNILNSASAFLAGGLTSLIGKGLGAIGGAIGGLFKSEETKEVSPRRDQFFAQFGGYEGLASALTRAHEVAGIDDAGRQADALIRSLFDAKHFDQFKSAQGDIARIFGLVGRNVQQFATGTGGEFVDFGRGTLAMLHGREAVVPQGRASEFAARPGGSVEIHVHTHLDGREVARTIVPYWSRALATHGLA